MPKATLAIGLIVFLLATLSVDPALAQNSNAPIRSLPTSLHFSHLTEEQGLLSDSIFSIAQDSKGFMWFGTFNGLNRYDGYEFKAYRSDPGDPNSLSSDAIRKILVDEDGVLWVGTWLAGLCRFDSSIEQFTCYRHDPDDPGSLSDDAIREVIQDRDGMLWIGTQDRGLDRLNPETGQIVHYPHDPSDPHSLSNNHIEVIYQDHDGVLWIGTHNGGLNRYASATATDSGAGPFTHYRHDPNDPTSLGHDDVRTIYEDHTGTLWVGTWGGGLNRFDRETGSFIRYLHDPDDPQSVSDNNIRPIYEDRTGNLWVGTSGGGLNKFDRETGTFARYQYDANDPHSLSHNHTRALYEDRAGALWVGTFGGGLNKYDRGAEKFAGLQFGVGALQGISPSAVMSILEGRDSALWLGTNGSGLIRYDRASKDVSHYQHDPADAGSLAQNSIWEIFEDRMGVLWIGTESQGLDRFDQATGKFTHYQHDSVDPNSLSNNGVYAILEDRAGNLWIGTNGGGLNQLDRETGAFARYQHDPEDPGSLSHNNLSVIHEDQKGTLWIGTWGGGISRLDHGSGQFVRYQNNPEDPRSLSDDNVFAILEGREGDLWFGTGGGLSRLDLASGQFMRYTTQQGLSSNMVAGVLQDDILPDQGGPNLWLSTYDGISRFNLTTETSRIYDASDGLHSETFSVSSYHKGRNGELFFGADNGITAFHPEQIEDNPNTPPIAITRFSLANKPVPIGAESVLQRSILETDHLVLSHLERVFSFEFSALNYRSSEKNRYKYRLDGFEEDWNEVGSGRRFATYTNLSPGAYAFRVIGSNNDGVWNEEGVSIQITITPPWWQTAWFRVFAGLMVTGLIAGAFVWQRQSAKRRERLLENHIAERKKFTQQLVTSNDRFRAFMDNSIEGIWCAEFDEPIDVGLPEEEQFEMVYKHGYISDANDAYARSFGLKRGKELVGTRIEEFCPRSEPTNVVTIKAWIQNRYTMRDAETIETYNDGVKRTVLNNSVGLINKGRVERVWGTNTDITERKNFQQQLIDAERKYRTVADHTYDWEYWETPDNNLVYVSPSCERISGYCSIEFMERPQLMADIVIPEDQSTWDNHRHGLKDDSNPAPSPIRFRIKTKSGQIRWIAHVCQSVYNEQGDYDGTRASNRDITELLDNQRLLDKQRDMLTHLDRKDTLGQLTGSIAHELNQPLTGILSCAQAGELLIGRANPDNVQIGEILTSIVADTKRASRIIRNLRELFGKKKIEITSLNVNTLITDTIQILHSEFIHQGVSINTDLHTKLPNVKANRIQLQQLLINLLKNAFEAMQHPEMTNRWVSINTTLDNDDQVVICLADSGPGIDPDQLETIFDPLVTTKETGMGMGLAICTSIVQAHGGRIWAENNTKGGTSFYFTLHLASE